MVVQGSFTTANPQALDTARSQKPHLGHPVIELVRVDLKDSAPVRLASGTLAT